MSNPTPDVREYSDDDSLDYLDEERQVVRTKVVRPTYARKVPRRTLILAGISVLSLILWFVLQATLADMGNQVVTTGVFNTWRVVSLAQLTFWSGLVLGALALLSWLEHARDREHLARLQAVARRNTSGKPRGAR